MLKDLVLVVLLALNLRTKGITYIGQAFAGEFFSAFTNKHPDRLTSV